MAEHGEVVETEVIGQGGHIVGPLGDGPVRLGIGQPDAGPVRGDDSDPAGWSAGEPAGHEARIEHDRRGVVVPVVPVGQTTPVGEGEMGFGAVHHDHLRLS